MGFLKNIQQFGRLTKAASDVHATLQELFKPVQMRSADFANDPYVVGFIMGASNIVAQTLGFKGDDVSRIVGIVMGTTFGKEASPSKDPRFNEGAENGFKVATVLYAPVGTDVTDPDYIRAKAEVAGIPGGKVGSQMVKTLLHDHILATYRRS